MVVRSGKRTWERTTDADAECGSEPDDGHRGWEIERKVHAAEHASSAKRRGQRVSPKSDRNFWKRETAEAYRQLNERLTENQNMLGGSRQTACQSAEEEGTRFSEWRAKRPTFGGRRVEGARAACGFARSNQQLYNMLRIAAE